ncbi:MBL fold metallo-hydrolase [Mesorhizobium sp. LSHC422A00]|uniref:MBL fold metallo-hydrolase n=1 Tax=Mesorhizobium sp. LSHC422A00 TaxID=1287294 RepID=UPI000A0388FB|nr:MBL fold metallo-hydrolase [Mesorhizobium sp. LSHC422A00]
MSAGAGFGESSAVHVGGGKWIIVDSCIDRTTKKPAALAYLASIGVDVALAVELIIITHWHDDHIRGLSEVVGQCKAARVGLSAAFTEDEFLNFVELFGRSKNSIVSSGVDEISAAVNTLKRSGRKVTAITAAKRLLQRPSVDGLPEVEVWGLSPSDAQFGLAMAHIASQLPKVMSPKRRVPEPEHNDLSVATWIRVGNQAILLGADLEEVGRPDLGWSAVLADPGRPPGKAILFKIPHHGSSNGHHDGVWSEMLFSEPTAMLTPYSKGWGLPRDTDVDRILGYAPQSYTTATLSPSKLRRYRPRAVEKTISEVAQRITAALTPAGFVRARFTPPGAQVSIALSGNACHLADYVREES